MKSIKAFVGIAALALSTALLTACGASGNGGPDANGLSLDGHGKRSRAVIVRDEYGVPHIHARSVEALFYANSMTPALILALGAIAERLLEVVEVLVVHDVDRS